jgi:non-heme chloroperoxidase
MSQPISTRAVLSRRDAILAGAALSVPLALPSASDAATPSNAANAEGPATTTITTRDGARLFYKDWGKGQPVVFSHGWPLSSDAWDSQMLFFGQNGYRVVAHDRRGHGRSHQTWDGNNMDQYADDLAELIVKLDLKNMIMIGHSTGGGEVAHYIGRHGTSRVAKVVLVGRRRTRARSSRSRQVQRRGAGLHQGVGDWRRAHNERPDHRSGPWHYRNRSRT